MKNDLKTVLAMGMIVISIHASGQTNSADYRHTKEDKKTAKTYLDLMVNVVSTNLNYGGSNGALGDFKKSINGIQAGASFQAGITPVFSVVPEIYYLRKGGKLKTGNPLTTNESTLQLNTLELPLLARFHVGKFYINAGPSIAYNLSGKSKVDEHSTKLSFANSSEGYKRFDGGMQAGGGVEFPFKQKIIALDIRYCYGLTNLANDKEIYNRALMISIHFSKVWKTNPFGKKNL